MKLLKSLSLLCIVMFAAHAYCGPSVALDQLFKRVIDYYEVSRNTKTAENSLEFRLLLLIARGYDEAELYQIAGKLNFPTDGLRSDLINSDAIRKVSEYLGRTGSTNSEAIENLYSPLFPANVLDHIQASEARLDGLTVIGRRAPLMSLLSARELVASFKDEAAYKSIVEKASALLSSQWPDRKLGLCSLVLFEAGLKKIFPPSWQ